MKVIGIDIGTTSICGVVLESGSGEILSSYTHDSDAFLPTQNDWEKIQDVGKIFSIVKDVLDRLLSEHADVFAIGFTGQMHGIVYINANGEAVSPLYTWQDGRGNLPYGDTTYAEHLGSFAGYGNVTDFYNRENGLVPKDALSYCTVHDFCAMALCKNTSPLLHASDAASLGLYDPEKKCFDYDYRPALTDDFAIIGEYRGIPVSVAIGDNQASVFSTLADEGGILVNVGTGSQISIVSSHPIVAQGIESRPYVDGKYLIVGAALCGGRAYSILRDFYKKAFAYVGAGDADVYAVMDAMLSEKEETTLRVDTRFDGTRTDTGVRGSIENITLDNLTPEDLTLGVLYGMVNELHAMYLSMAQVRCGVVASGNGVRKNRALARAIERVFGKLRVPVHTEEAATGAALFALVAAGGCASAREAQKCIQYTEV